MTSLLFMFFNQMLFTLSSVVASFYLKTEGSLVEIVMQSWIVGYIMVRIVAVLMQMRTLKSNSVLKSISVLCVFNIVLTLLCAYLFLGEMITFRDMMCVILTIIALFLL